METKHVFNDYIKAVSAGAPIFTRFDGGVYELEIARAAIHSVASEFAKLRLDVSGEAKPHLKRVLPFRPNRFMSAYQFLYRLATILLVNNTAFILPVEDAAGMLTGYYPILPQLCEVKESNGRFYLVYSFGDGSRAAAEMERVGLLTRFQYQDDFFGADNAALRPTMDVLHAQNEGIKAGVRNSAYLRFIVKALSVTMDDEDLIAARDRFAEQLSPNNKSGTVIADAAFKSVEQLNAPQPFVANAVQIEQTRRNVMMYFGTNEKIITGQFTEDEHNSFFETSIEPLAVQTSMAMTNMTFSGREVEAGSEITLSDNQMRHASGRTKLSLAQTLFDRGIITTNQARALWGMPPVDGGDKRFIRKEYMSLDGGADAQGSYNESEAGTNAGNE